MNYGAPIWISFSDPDLPDQFVYVNARLIAGWQPAKNMDGRGKMFPGSGTILMMFGGAAQLTAEPFADVTKKMLELKMPNEIGDIET